MDYLPKKVFEIVGIPPSHCFPLTDTDRGGGKDQFLRLKKLGRLIPSVVLPSFIIRTKYLVIDPILGKVSEKPFEFQK